MNAAMSYLVFMAALVALWFLLTRNARAQRRQIAELQAEIKIGDEVIITAGIFGTVRSVEDDRVRLEIAEGTVITVARSVVVRTVPTDEPGSDEAPIDEQTKED